MTLSVAILCGGRSTRLGDLTKEIPKSLIEVAGEPFIFHQLRMLKAQGFIKVVLCVGHLGEQFMQTVGDGRDFGMTIDYSFDGIKALGTGGALKRALPKLKGTFIAMYGDSYLPTNYTEIVEEFVWSQKKGLMTVARCDDAHANTVVYSNEVHKYDKDKHSSEMHHVDYGISVLSVEAFHRLPTEFDLSVLYSRLIRDAQMAAYEISDPYYDIGTPNGLDDLRNVLSVATRVNV